jgi:Tfp pilus assembly protein PilN
MNAVNLIPREDRSRRQGLPVSPPTLALMGGLILILIAAVLYVTAANTVATRKSELAQVSAGVASWTAAGNSYDPFVSADKNRTQQLANVRQLASARFPWSDLLGQIGARMPPAAALITLNVTPSSAGDGSATSSTSASGIQLTGCAASQSVVAQTMVQLRLVNGVSGVTLGTSSDTSTGSGGSGSSSSGQGGGCPFPVQFQLSLTLRSSYVEGTASSSSASATSAPASTTSAPASTTSAPASTTSTAAAAQ